MHFIHELKLVKQKLKYGEEDFREDSIENLWHSLNVADSMERIKENEAFLIEEQIDER